MPGVPISVNPSTGKPQAGLLPNTPSNALVKSPLTGAMVDKAVAAAQAKEFAPTIAGKPNPPTPTQVTNAKNGIPDQSKTQIMAMQQFLKNRGYNISVDGVRGPETNAVVAAFHNHVTPQQYAARTKASTKTAPPASNAPAGAAPTVTTDTSTPVVTPPTNTQVIDPTAYATGQTNAQYDPQIATLAQQISQGKAQGTQDQTDIGNWYNQLLALANNTGKANAATGQTAIDDYNNASNTSLSQLFGGPGASPSADEASAFHDIQSGALAGGVSAQSAFDANLKSILAASGNEAKVGQLNKDNTNVSNLAQQMVSLKGAKGQAYGTAFQQGIQAQTQQQAALQASQLAAAIAPAQIATANASAITAGVNASTAPAIAAANLRKATAQANAAIANSGGTWNLSQPSQRGALQTSFETNIMGPNKGLSMDAGTAWNNIQLQLQSAGLAGNPQAETIAKNTFLQALHTSHANGQQGGWAWNGKKVVPTGNKYTTKSGKRVLVNSKGTVVPNYVPKS